MSSSREPYVPPSEEELRREIDAVRAASSSPSAKTRPMGVAWSPNAPIAGPLPTLGLSGPWSAKRIGCVVLLTVVALILVLILALSVYVYLSPPPQR